MTRPRTHDVAALYVDPRQSARFWSKVDKNGPTLRAELGPCWVWTASRDRKGYGSIGWGSKTDGTRRPIGAHRFAWWIATGAMPLLCVLHKCDNPSCVRLDHLFLGTVADNNRDMFAKGRASVGHAIGDRNGARQHPEQYPRGDAHYARLEPDRLARGARHGGTRLTADDVLRIRAAKSSGVSVRVIAERHSISVHAVYAIVSRRNWGHVA